MSSTTFLRLHGPFAAVSDGRPVPFAGRGADRLLAYLALNGPAERGRVAQALWPGVDRARALASLRQTLRAVALAAGEGWVVAERADLRLHERVAVGRGEGPLLEGWDEPWIDVHRSRPAQGPPVEALFDLLAWYGERDPRAALRLAAEASSALVAAPAARIVREIAPVVGRLGRLTGEDAGLVNHVARAQYLLGRMEAAHALYGRLAHELDPARHGGTIADALLSQAVLLRESGAARAAARRAAIVVARPPVGDRFGWTARYHLGLSLHLAEEPEGLRLALAAVDAGAAEDDALGRLFPVLNVAEGLLDARDPAADRLLHEARRLALLARDALGDLTLEMLEGLRLAPAAPDAALDRLRTLERRAWEARLVPFATGLADRAAVLAHRLGRLDDARRLLRRADRTRKRLGLRRAPLERARLVPLRG